MYGVDPRIPGLHIEPVPCSEGVVLAFSIPKSWAGPHMVTLKGTSRFFARNSNARYQLDVHQIRDLFVSSESRAERLRRFRLDRLAYIAGGESVLGQPAHGVTVVHLLPFQMLDVRLAWDSANFERVAHLRPAPISVYTAAYRYNFDGLVNYESGKRSYVQIFRSGALEAGDSALLEGYQGKRYIPSISFEDKICRFLRGALQFQRAVGVEPPIYVFLSLLNVRGYSMSTSSQDINVLIGLPLIDSNEVMIPEITVSSFDGEPFSILRPAFDLVWSAAGWPRSMNYDEAGIWVHKR